MISYPNQFLTNQEMRICLNVNCRHRKSSYFPEAENTPPGYWKPFLTETTISPRH
ncbi:hypothetical protein Phum_PHUM467130 [Pediculus humanus corporis]|uniref:Uncharacterized protein n=1 Tax=Pediculus humanus subsp. corporis TaxID=121224 RepID=E0VVR1_PEDHC|nr:uncharacterized protein Phum_PHUM467130 [Pediculus humanus corporis]EEB17467.1 hypothetical protein Phum_PHUM467130 [Pediculus humanus corporis]